MAIFSLDQFPEVFVSNRQLSSFVSRGMKKGLLRKLSSRLYTKNLTDPPELIVRRNVWPIVGEYFPDGLIADRTAIENTPAKDGSIFLISKKTRKVEIPGITIHPRIGVGPLASDKPFINNLHLCSTARAYLENMVPSRARTGVSRTLSNKEFEERLESLLQLGGEQELKKLRDQMRELAPNLGLEKEFHQINRIIGTLLGTQRTKLESDVGKFRAAGMPYDPKRLELFNQLYTTLVSTAPIIRLEKDSDEVNVLAFFDAYFSNFIEGTEFQVNEAKEIIFDGKIPRDRPEDAHDILGTYRLASDLSEMKRIPQTFEEFIILIQSRHATIMEQRPDSRPGKFKIIENRAGATVFVSPELVKGTLKKGFDLYRALELPFHRAIFMMYLISEVHPFTDGNGRLGRIMMNCELIGAGECRIVIPTIYRNNYMVALKALSQSCRITPLIRTLDFAQKYTHSIDWSSFARAQSLLEKTDAFMDPNDADLRGIRLHLPAPGQN